MKAKYWISGAIAASVLAVTTSVVFANSASSKQVGGDVMNLPTNSTTISTTVTHTPLTGKELNSLGWAGLHITPLNTNSSDAQGILTESEAIQTTDILMQQFGGTDRTVQLVKTSRLHSDGTAPVYTSAQTGNDPHFIDGRFKNIPCYLVVIHGVNVPSAGGAPLPNGQQPIIVPDKNTLVVLVDATTGANLLMYAINQ